MQIKLISTRNVLHLFSIWQQEFLDLEINLYYN